MLIKFSIILLLSTIFSVQAATLFYLEPSDKNCLAKKMNFSSMKEEVLFTASECPTKVLMAKDGQIYGVNEDGKVFTYGKDQKQIAKFPRPDVSLKLKEGKLMVAYLKNIPEKNVTSVTNKDQSVSYTYLFEGKKYVTCMLTSWGIPFDLNTRLAEDYSC